MLVLTRKIGQDILVPEIGIVFRILEIHEGKVRVGISAPEDIQVHRAEVWQRLGSDQAATPVVGQKG